MTGATSADPVVITATSHGFSNGDEVDIFDIIWEPDVDSVFNETQPDQLNTKRYKVANKTTNTFEISRDYSYANVSRGSGPAGVGVDGSGFNDYFEGGTVRLAVLTVTGLEHLEGRAVSVLADGNVLSGLTVSSASITLPRKFSRIHVGLPYVCDIETLNVETPAGSTTIRKSKGTIQGYQQKIAKVTLKVNNSRGWFVGPDNTKLVENKQREFELMGNPTSVKTGDDEIYLKPDWNSNGRVFIRAPYPLPFTLLAVIPSVETGEHS
jgi:hypothetical protein